MFVTVSSSPTRASLGDGCADALGTRGCDAKGDADSRFPRAARVVRARDVRDVVSIDGARASGGTR
jgi:hypothetical protein